MSPLGNLFSKKGRKKERNYRSEEAKDDPDPDRKKRKDPFLILGDAPPKPYFAGAGLSSNTTYQIQRNESDEYSEENKGETITSFDPTQRNKSVRFTMRSVHK